MGLRSKLTVVGMLNLLTCLRRTALYSPDSRNMKNIPSKYLSPYWVGYRADCPRPPQLPAGCLTAFSSDLLHSTAMNAARPVSRAAITRVFQSRYLIWIVTSPGSSRRTQISLFWQNDLKRRYIHQACSTSFEEGPDLKKKKETTKWLDFKLSFPVKLRNEMFKHDFFSQLCLLVFTFEKESSITFKWIKEVFGAFQQIELTIQRPRFSQLNKSGTHHWRVVSLVSVQPAWSGCMLKLLA